MMRVKSRYLLRPGSSVCAFESNKQETEIRGHPWPRSMSWEIDPDLIVNGAV